jgi:hypothetical protein
MTVKKLALPRRTVLRGMGAAVALPLLDAMVPAFTATVKTAASPVKRLGVIYTPHSMIMKFFTPATEGTDFELTPILRPIERFRDQLTIITGLANAGADAIDQGSGPHSRVSGCWLNGTRVRRTEGADIHAGRTMDQFAADELGKESPLRSLELALEPNFVVGGCEGGYSCAYINTLSWATAERPLPMETNPAVIFERLFGDGGTGSVRLAHMRGEESILDSVSTGVTRLRAAIGPSDRRAVEEYLEAVRDVERRLQQTASRVDVNIDNFEKPFGIPAAFDDHAKLMFDLMWLAYRTDMTRVVTFQLARELSLRSYPELGVPEAHHDISHHGYDADKMERKSRIDAYHMKLVAHFVERMAATPDGDGSLLDHSMLLYGSGMGDSHIHHPHNLPIMLIGSGRGALKPGRHIKTTIDTPFMNLCLTILDKLDVHLDSLGDSTGRLTGI